MLEDNLTLPSNGKLYSKVLNWVQRCLWENGEQLEQLMEEVSTKARSSLNSQTYLPLCCAPLPPTPVVFYDINMSLRGLKQKSHANVMLLLFFSV